MHEKMNVFVKSDPESLKIAVEQNDTLVEYYEQKHAGDTLVNAIFLGKVDRIVKGLDAAFVKIDQPKNGFLPLKEMASFEASASGNEIAAGAEIIVQVKKDPKGDKGAYLSRDIVLPGLYAIYMPLNHHIGVSNRITDEKQRKALSALGKHLAEERHGIVMRSAALTAKESEIQEELETLEAEWCAILKKAMDTKAPSLLYGEENMLSVLIRDYAPRYDLEITGNDRVNRMPAATAGLLWKQIDNDQMDALWSRMKVEAQLRKALNRVVSLDNGSTLMIDEREALTTIDVNSGSYCLRGDVAYELNLMVCREIALQIRLRNLSGIIMIDFVDMDSDEKRAHVQEKLEKYLLYERQKTVVHGFTSLGLMEMTRKRTGVSLRDMLMMPCPHCHGTGYIRKGHEGLA